MFIKPKKLLPYIRKNHILNIHFFIFFSYHIDFNTLSGHELAHLKFGEDSEYEARYVELGYEEYLKGVKETGYLSDSEGISDWQHSILTDEDRQTLIGYSDDVDRLH